MATFDEVYADAVQLLADRKLVMNPQLLRLVGGNDAVLAKLRLALINDGYAIDRFGVGLAWANNPLARPSNRGNSKRANIPSIDGDFLPGSNAATESIDFPSASLHDPLEIEFATATSDIEDHVEPDSVDQVSTNHMMTESSADGFGVHEPQRSSRESRSVKSHILGAKASHVEPAVDDHSAEWWIMADGTVRGPLRWQELVDLATRGEIIRTDLVRDGHQNPWQQAKDVTGLHSLHEARFPADGGSKGEGLRMQSEPGRVGAGFDDGPQNLIAMRETSSSISEPISPTIPLVETRTSNRNQSAAKPRTQSQSFPPTKTIASQGVVPAKQGTVSGADDSELRSKNSADDAEFFVWDGGRSVGPLTREELRGRLDSGRLLADEFVQVGQDGEWQPASIALFSQRPPLRIPTRGGSLSDVEINSLSESDPTMSAPKPSSMRMKYDSEKTAHPVRDVSGIGTIAKGAAAGRTSVSPNQTGSKNSPTSQRNRSAVEQDSSLRKFWNQAAEFLGGESRLWGVIVGFGLLLALVMWWRQSPSADSVYREFAECHAKIQSLRQRNAGRNAWNDTLAYERKRIALLVDGLRKRAGARRPAEQQLLWAGEKGLLVLLGNPTETAQVESIYQGHMANVAKILKIELKEGTASQAGTHSKTKPIDGMPKGDSLTPTTNEAVEK